MITVPPYLKNGDTIGIVCPAGYMSQDRVKVCVDTLQQWGFNVKVGKTVGNQFHYFSGTDAERLDDLQQMIDDSSVHAILCGRGGYGVGRIIDDIDFSTFIAKPKWIIGFSDITVLLSHLYTKYNTASLHSPMAGAFNDGGASNEYVQSLRKAITGELTSYTCKANALNRKGKAKGDLIGGNLSLIAHLVGTESDIDTDGEILFLEDVGEYVYNVDRMMLQLKRSGKLARLAGLVVGGFSEMKDTTTPFGQNVYDLIWDKVKEYNYPVCFGFPVSHDTENYALKVGVGYELEVGEEVRLSELGY